MQELDMVLINREQIAECAINVYTVGRVLRRCL